LNCLVDGGYLSPGKLAAIKRGYANLIGADIVDMNYNYRRSPGKMVHTLKYVTRATFRDWGWDMAMAMELRGFRNMVVWGRGQWDGQPVWSLANLTSSERPDEVKGLDVVAIESLVNKVCPICGKAPV